MNKTIRWSWVITLTLTMACSDEAAAPDSSPPDFGTDLPVPDLQRSDLPPPDLLVPDLSPLDLPVPDLPVPDLTMPDLPVPDLTLLDLPLPDLPIPDLSVPDLAIPDLPVPDLFSPDLPLPDLPAPDLVASDGGAIFNVLYMTGSNSSQLSGMRIMTDGTGKKAATGFPGPFTLKEILVYGQRLDLFRVNRQVPALFKLYNNAKGVALPKGNGSLYHYYASSPSGAGFFQVRPDGTVKSLVHASGFSTTQHTYHAGISLNLEGTVFAAVMAYQSFPQISLVRLDGKTYASTKTGVCTIALSSLSANMASPWGSTFGHKYFYFSGRDKATGSYRLFRAPLDCSASPTVVSLPKVGSITPTMITWGPVRSHDGKKVILSAGSSSNSNDVIVVDDATGGAANISEAPSRNRLGGYLWFSSNPCNFDISPGNVNIAWVEEQAGGSSSNWELYVRRLDKSTKKVHITNSLTFDTSIKWLGGVFWATDDDLLFWAGSSSKQASDLFHHKVSTGVVTNLTKTGSAAAPFKTSGKLRGRGGWLSPNGKFIHFVRSEASGSGEIARLHSMELATLKLTEVTPATLRVLWGDSYMSGSPGSSRVFFSAYPVGKQFYENLYSFDQNAPAPATNLTNQPATGPQRSIYAVNPNKAGTRVAFYSGYPQRNLYVLDVKSKPVLHKLTNVVYGTYLRNYTIFTPDSEAVIHGIGTISSLSYDLRMNRVSGGAPVILHTAQEYNTPLLAW